MCPTLTRDPEASTLWGQSRENTQVLYRCCFFILFDKSIILIYYIKMDLLIYRVNANNFVLNT